MGGGWGVTRRGEEGVDLWSISRDRRLGRGSEFLTGGNGCWLPTREGDWASMWLPGRDPLLQLPRSSTAPEKSTNWEAKDFPAGQCITTTLPYPSVVLFRKIRPARARSSEVGCNRARMRKPAAIAPYLHNKTCAIFFEQQTRGYRSTWRNIQVKLRKLRRDAQ